MGSEQGLFLTFSLDAYEHLDSLVITGPGLSLVRRLHLREPPYDGQNAFSDLQLGCGYHYTPCGTSSSDCDCMVGRTGEVHGELSLRWTFEADPAEALDVWPTPAVVSMYPSGGWTSEIHEQATYGDGVPAPLPDTTTLRYSATTPWGYLFLKRCYYGSCSYPQQGASVETAYRGLYQVHFAARNDEGAAPMCDVDVPVRVTGGGVSGETTVTIQGSGSDPTSDTLQVWAEPGSIALGDSAQVYARHFAAGCGGGEMPDATLMTISVDSALRGSLAYGTQRGATISGVPYGEVKAGAVSFVADGLEPPCAADTVVVTVSGGGVDGTGPLVVEAASAARARGRTAQAVTGNESSQSSGELVVSVHPPEIEHGASASVYAEHHPNECGDGEFAGSTLMTVSVGSDVYGSLAYGSQRGVTINAVPYDDVKSGAVSFSADGEEPLYDGEVIVSVTGGGQSGSASLLVQGDIQPIECTTGDPVLDAAASSDVLKELWEASKPQADIRDRLEQGVWIVQRPDGSYLFVPYGGTSTNCTINPSSFPDPGLGTLLGGIHTHPASLGERLWGCPRNKPFGAGEIPQVADKGPGRGDTDAITGDEAALGIELNSYILDPDTIFKYNENGVIAEPVQRCGY